MDYHKLKEEIISFVRDSPEEVNSRIAIFIAGMQAQKNLTSCRRESSGYPPAVNEVLKTDRMKE